MRERLRERVLAVARAGSVAVPAVAKRLQGHGERAEAVGAELTVTLLGHDVRVFDPDPMPDSLSSTFAHCLAFAATVPQTRPVPNAHRTRRVSKG